MEPEVRSGRPEFGRASLAVTNNRDVSQARGQRSGLAFDPRSQLLIVLLAGAACALVSWTGALALTFVLALYLAVQGLWKAGLSFLIGMALLAVAYAGSISAGVTVLDFVAFMLGLLLRTLPVVMAAYPLGFVPSGRLIASLQRLHLPKGLLVALAVALRFLPMLRLEYESVQTSARLRGLSASKLKNWKNPLKMFEYRIVPLLMRSLKIADELAASASVRGIEAPGKRTSIYIIRLNLQDYAAPIFFIGATAAWMMWGTGG
ncbi:energy-coupling factor transporter transmembrane component T [Saccharibacillus sacchari]|uniref:Energy-coupling factor transporter transmembrane component T n=1 Tax=Saccharibacillus sacchari TaxID=456493 RepID=A0ACC6PC86_9BACL